MSTATARSWLACPACNFSIQWSPDGRLLIISGALLLRREADGSLVTHADLVCRVQDAMTSVVDGRGNIYVNGPGFSLMSGEPPKPGFVALVSPTTLGMAMTPDNSTLILGEPYAQKLTAFDIATARTLSGGRVWAEAKGDHPDDSCLDVEGADPGCFACMPVRTAAPSSCWQPSGAVPPP